MPDLSTYNNYDPESLGADCRNCPFYRAARPRPVPTESATREPKGILLGESPGNEEHYHLKPFVGPTGDKLNAKLQENGLRREEFHIVNAIACRPVFPKTDSRMRRAAKCCKPRLDAELERFQRGRAEKLPIFAMGKWARLGVLNQHDAKLSHGILHNGVMSAPHPSFAYMHNPVNQFVFEAYLSRFADRLRGGKPMTWPKMILGPTEEALAAIEAMGPIVGFDVETLGADPLASKITCFGLSDGVNTVSVPWDTYETKKHGLVTGLDEINSIGPKIKETCLRIVTDRDREICTQNGQYDVLTMRARGIDVVNGFDTMLAHWVCWPKLSHNLEAIACQMLDIPNRWKTFFRNNDEDAKGSAAYEESDPLTLRDYNAKDCIATYWLRMVLAAELETVHRGWEHFERRMACARIAMTSYEYGWPVDLEKVAELDDTLIEKISQQELKLRELLTELGRPNLNPDSPVQMQELFYELLEEPVTFRTDSGAPSTGKKARAVFRDSQNPYSAALAEVLDERKKYKKLKEAYVDNVTEELVRPQAKVHGALSGRWSYPKPALQTTPSGMKPMFIAPEDYWIIGCDFSALEARLIALYDGDDILLNAFNNKLDVHTENAKGLFGTNDIQKHQRQAAKLFMYNINYSSLDVEKCAEGMLAVLKTKFPDMTYNHVLGLNKRWWKAHPALQTGREKVAWQIRKFDYIEEPLGGWRRYFYGKPKETEGFNFRPQAGGAFCMDRALIAIHAELAPDDGFLLQRHDELVFCTKDPIRIAKLLWKHMRQRLVLDDREIWLELDYWITRRWGITEAAGETVEELADEFTRIAA